ncbi:MAG: hypothetical protein HY443_01060 [Candidatus Nealsonbacteria bacterium]|nr:hypothetical protein [Candidatus Nealsonbacteria bacterium]
MTTKEQFLLDHNKLCSLDLRATMELLSRFEVEKPGLCKNGNWSMEKVRRPFIMWLTSLKQEDRRSINRGIA